MIAHLAISQRLFAAHALEAQFATKRAAFRRQSSEQDQPSGDGSARDGNGMRRPAEIASPADARLQFRAGLLAPDRCKPETCA
jgi:hypothetical protein